MQLASLPNLVVLDLRENQVRRELLCVDIVVFAASAPGTLVADAALACQLAMADDFEVQLVMRELQDLVNLEFLGLAGNRDGVPTNAAPHEVCCTAPFAWATCCTLAHVGCCCFRWHLPMPCTAFVCCRTGPT